MIGNNLVVFGGNGFLGKRICQQAVKAGFEVTSLSRSGNPPVITTPGDHQWINKVNWEKANLFDPNSYKKHIKDTNHVVHSVGILLENQSYKKILANPLSLFDVFSSKNVLLEPKIDNHNIDEYHTYEMVNTKSAILAAESFHTTLTESMTKIESNPSFTYISADKQFPLIPSGYINSKRNTELQLMKYDDKFRPIIMRPGFMFDETNKHSLNIRSALSDTIGLLNCTNKYVLKKKITLLNELIRSTVSTQQVAKIIIRKIKNNGFEGIVTLDEMTR